jgi:hypothetical protein
VLSKLATWHSAARSNCSSCWPAATPPRTWRSWCSATNSPCCVGRSHAPGSSPPTAPTRGAQPGTAALALVVLLREARHAAALASATGRRRLDLPAPWNRATATRPGHPGADRQPGQGEPALGLPAHQGRAVAPWCSDLGDRDPHHAAPPWTGSDAAADDHHLAGVPAPAGRRDPRVRLLHRRQHLAAPGCTCCSSSSWTPAASTWPE